MLTKLLKHEFRATARIMGPLYLVLLAVALGFNFSARLMDSGNFVLNMLAALVVMAYVVAITAVFIVAFILMLQRFYKNLLGDEGYIMFQQMTAYYAVNGTVFALELLALMLAACMSFSLQFYAALAAGHSFANHKMALSVAFFFAFQFVVQMAGAIVLVLLDEGPLHQFLLTLDFQLTGVAAVHFTMVALLLLTVLYGAIFYIVTTITLKKRLNLE